MNTNLTLKNYQIFDFNGGTNRTFLQQNVSIFNLVNEARSGSTEFQVADSFGNIYSWVSANISLVNMRLPTQFSSTTAPTSSQTLLPANNSSTSMPTTNWVQTAITASRPTLSEVLVTGNSAGSTGINMNNNPISNVGILTTTNAIDMIGTSTALNNIATRQLSLKDGTNGNSNGSLIRTNNNVLILDSVGPNATNASTQFTLRNAANDTVIPLQLTTSINNMNVPLDMTAGQQSLSAVRSRLYAFRDINTGATTTSSISQNVSNIVIDAAENNSAINFQTKTSGGTVVTPLQLTSTTNIMNVPLNMNNKPISNVTTMNLSGILTTTNAIDMIGGETSTTTYISTKQLKLKDSGSGSFNGTVIYTNENNLILDSRGPFGANSTMDFYVKNSSNSSILSLQLTNTTIKTDCYAITALPTTDNSNTIPTTKWVQNVLSSVLIKRAYSEATYLGDGGNTPFDISISNSGTSSLVFNRNDNITFRVTLHQQWANTGIQNTSTLYQTCYANVILYPWRFTSGWLTQTGAPNGAPRGEINLNAIYTTSSLTGSTAFALTDSTYTPNGRQFWCEQLNWAYNGTAPVGRLYISGVSGSVNTVRIIVANPYGFSAVPSGGSSIGEYSYSISVELLNPNSNGALITTSGFAVDF